MYICCTTATVRSTNRVAGQKVYQLARYLFVVGSQAVCNRLLSDDILAPIRNE
jgi:hypothetical protein